MNCGSQVSFAVTPSCGTVPSILSSPYRMSFLSKLCLGALSLSLAVPSGFAKIYPDDFLILPPQDTSAPAPSPSPAPSSPSQPFFFASEIPDGRLSRAQLADALATRLYTADAHDDCFAGLILSNTVNYDLLYNDVSLDAPYATSICLGMQNGIARGYADGAFRPNQMVTVAEAAESLTSLGGTPLRDSNHVRPGEPWYQRFMEAMRAVNREFTMKPTDIMTGVQLRHSLCILKRMTPALDPLDEFTGC